MKNAAKNLAAFLAACSIQEIPQSGLVFKASCASSIREQVGFPLNNKRYFAILFVSDLGCGGGLRS